MSSLDCKHTTLLGATKGLVTDELKDEGVDKEAGDGLVAMFELVKMTQGLRFLNPNLCGPGSFLFEMYVRTPFRLRRSYVGEQSDHIASEARHLFNVLYNLAPHQSQHTPSSISLKCEHLSNMTGNRLFLTSFQVKQPSAEVKSRARRLDESLSRTRVPLGHLSRVLQPVQPVCPLPQVGKVVRGGGQGAAGVRWARDGEQGKVGEHEIRRERWLYSENHSEEKRSSGEWAARVSFVFLSARLPRRRFNVSCQGIWASCPIR